MRNTCTRLFTGKYHSHSRQLEIWKSWDGKIKSEDGKDGNEASKGETEKAGVHFPTRALITERKGLQAGALNVFSLPAVSYMAHSQLALLLGKCQYRAQLLYICWTVYVFHSNRA